MALLPVLGTGLSGLVGSKVVELLSDRYSFQNLDLSAGVDITNAEQVEAAVAASPAEVVLHLAAFTDLNAAETQKGDQSGSVYQVNVQGTRNLAQACAKHGKFLIHMSTGYVFDGTKTTPYVETDPTNPVDWYGQTKLEAEQVVQELLPQSHCILRINFPYRQDEFPKKDIWHKIATALQEGKTGPFFDDHFFTLTPIEWLADVIGWCFATKPVGIFHATADKVYTDITLAQEGQRSLGMTTPLERGSLAEYNQKSERKYAQSLILSSEKLKQARK
jgi:dTDP-4-dehydrorhamnose reductase